MIDRQTRRALTAFFLVFSSSSLFAETALAANDSVGATKALRALLELSNQPIPKKSSCYGAYVQRGTPTVKDFLAVQLENLSVGKNAIQGECTNLRCSVRITHDGGSEDVSSAEIRFSLNKGRAVISTLACAITP
jgi:hypothetical protein